MLVILLHSLYNALVAFYTLNIVGFENPADLRMSPVNQMLREQLARLYIIHQYVAVVCAVIAAVDKHHGDACIAKTLQNTFVRRRESRFGALDDQSVHTCRQQLLQRRRLVQRFIVRKSQRKQIVMTAQHPLDAVDDAGKNIIVQIRGQHTDSAGAGFAAVHPAGILLTYERAAPRRPLQQPLLLQAADRLPYRLPAVSKLLSKLQFRWNLLIRSVFSAIYLVPQPLL